MKLAFIDLDRVVVDCTLRFDRADSARRKFLANAWKAPTITIDGIPQQVEKTFDNKLPQWVYKKGEEEYWRVAFTPELIDLDLPISEVKQALDQIEVNGYRIVYLTSRPESLRPATETWLDKHSLALDAARFKREMIMKAPGFQFVKTVVWKVGMVQQFSILFGASSVLVIDDEQQIRDAIIEAQIKDVQVMRFNLLTAGSLPEAVKELWGE